MSLPQSISEQDLNTLAKAGVIPADAPADVVAVFAATCGQHRLSPFKREIYLVNYNGRYSTIVGIDGLRAKAARTGQLAGRDDAKFDVQPSGDYLTAAQLKQAGRMPLTCTVTVYRMASGVRCPFTKTVLFAEYCPASKSGKWATMPFNMIEKCAEAAALRMGFADETAGLHIEEEQAAMQDVTISAVGKGRTEEQPEVMPEDVEALYYDTQAALSNCDFDTLISLYLSHDGSKAIVYRQFALLFFESLDRCCETPEQLMAFWGATVAKWKGDAAMKGLLSKIKQKISK